MLRTSLRTLASASLLVVACVPAVADAPTAAAAGTVDDVKSALMALAAVVIPGVISWIGLAISGTMKDKNTREAAITLAQQLGSLALNVTDGVIKGASIPADKVPAVVSKALAESKNLDVKGVFDRAGFDGSNLVRLLIAHLPGVQGEVPDSVIHAIAAGTAGVAPQPDAAAALKAIEQLAEAISKNATVHA